MAFHPAGAGGGRRWSAALEQLEAEGGVSGAGMRAIRQQLRRAGARHAGARVFAPIVDDAELQAPVIVTFEIPRPTAGSEFHAISMSSCTAGAS